MKLYICNHDKLYNRDIYSLKLMIFVTIYFNLLYDIDIPIYLNNITVQK